MEMWESKGTGCGDGDHKESVQRAEKDHRHKSKEDDNLKHIWEGGKEKEWGCKGHGRRNCRRCSGILANGFYNYAVWK